MPSDKEFEEAGRLAVDAYGVCIHYKEGRLARLRAPVDPAFEAVREFLLSAGLYAGDESVKRLLAAVDAARANQKAGAK